MKLILQTRAGAIEELRLTKAIITIGAVSGNDVVVPDPTVSARHAELHWQRDGFVISDLKSTNGTYVNGQRIRGPRLLHEGDKITVGQTMFTFQAEPGSLPAGVPATMTAVAGIPPRGKARTSVWAPILGGVGAVLVVVLIIASSAGSASPAVVALTPTASPTTPSPTELPATPTPAPTNTPTVTPELTATATATATAAATATAVVSPTATPTSSLPTYSQVLQTYPMGVRLCSTNVFVVKASGDNWLFDLPPSGGGGIEIVDSKPQIKCHGTKLTLQVRVTAEGKTYEQGAKLTVDKNLHWIEVSSWD